MIIVWNISTWCIPIFAGFFSTEMAEEEKSKPLKRGRGSQKKTKVLVMAESIPIEGETTKRGKPRKGRASKNVCNR